MTVVDYLLLAFIGGWLVASIVFIRRQKKRGRCIGCSSSSCEACGRQNGKK